MTLHPMRVQAVITNPHITDWYSTLRICDFVQHWLYDTLTYSTLVPFEYQTRGSTRAWLCHAEE